MDPPLCSVTDQRCSPLGRVVDLNGQVTAFQVDKIAAKRPELAQSSPAVPIKLVAKYVLCPGFKRPALSGVADDFFLRLAEAAHVNATFEARLGRQLTGFVISVLAHRQFQPFGDAVVADSVRGKAFD